MSGTAFPTYIIEIDQGILQIIEDADLFNVCTTNSYVADICNDEVFWRNRAKTRYSILMKFKPIGVTWKAFYHRLVNDAMYVVRTNVGNHFLYSNIVDAYDKLWDELSKEYVLPVEEVKTMDHSETDYSSVINLIYQGEVTVVDNEFLLFDHRKPVADILQYPDLPGLKVVDSDLFYYSGARFVVMYNQQLGRAFSEFDETPHNEFHGVFYVNDEVLRAFMSYSPSYAPDYEHGYSAKFTMTRINTGDIGIQFYRFKYGYLSKPRRNRNRSSSRNIPYFAQTLVDLSLFGEPIEFQKFYVGLSDRTLDREQKLEIERQIEEYFNGSVTK